MIHFLIPFEQFNLQTSLDQSEILQRLSDNLEEEKAYRIILFHNSKTKAYEGTIESNTFSIRRIIQYRNSFLPRIHGTILPLEEGSLIKISMRLHPLLLAIIPVFIASIVYFNLNTMEHVLNPSDFTQSDLMPWAEILFVIGITLGGFKFESRQSRKFLIGLFEGELV